MMGTFSAFLGLLVWGRANGGKWWANGQMRVKTPKRANGQMVGKWWANGGQMVGKW